MFYTTLLSFLLLAIFIIKGIQNWGLLHSYSAYAAKWTTYKPMDNMHLWSLITFFVAALLAPAMINMAEGSSLQFLGFFAPLYLIIVSMTPEWASNDKQYRVHVIGASLCAAAAFVWLLFVQHAYLQIGIAAAFVAIMSGVSRTYKTCLTFWLEMLMFLSVYMTALQ